MTSTTATELLPTVQWGETEITRLIIGGNQIRGYSHVSPELDAEMRDYHTVDNTVSSWLRAEACGLNTMQSRGDAVIYERLRAYRERGGTMQWICQTAGEHPDPHDSARWRFRSSGKSAVRLRVGGGGGRQRRGRPRKDDLDP